MRLIVAHKNISVEYIDIHLKDKPEWFIPKINPHGQVPVIEHKGKLIRESAIAFGEWGRSHEWFVEEWRMGDIMF